MDLTSEKVFAYLRDRAGLDTSKITAETTFFTSSLLDSVSLVDLIVFVESEIGVRIEPEEVVIENFDSVAQILRFAASKKGV
jgi:acyl carrier protein